ncbi:hypothetical protein BSLG_004972 [Batrachochytrium salamandrivorans]|nr:hypothetical protein BSLG_004972 [Batrachochytrium salamandrivorans]
MQRSHAPMIMEAKTIWEELRQSALKQERRELMNRMMGLVTGKAKEIIFKHDANRIIQCCLKYGSPSQRDQIAKELSGHYAQLSQSQYGRFIVSKILNYCSPEYRSAVISEFYGKVRKLIRHKVSLILDEAYSQFANAAQRSALMEEFYGPEYAVFKSVIDPILHRAIYEYLTYADLKVAKDMIELLKDHFVLQGFVHAIATEQYGHSVLLTCFECIDDTVIVSKSLIAELLSPSSSSQAPGTEKTASRVAVASAGAAASISELLRNKYGSRNSKKIVFEEDNDEWEDDQDNTSESATDMATDPEDAPIDATSLLQEDSPIITDGDLSSTEKPFNAVTKLKSERDAANPALALTITAAKDAENEKAGTVTALSRARTSGSVQWILMVLPTLLASLNLLLRP